MAQYPRGMNITLLSNSYDGDSGGPGWMVRYLGGDIVSITVGEYEPNGWNVTSPVDVLSINMVKTSAPVPIEISIPSSAALATYYGYLYMPVENNDPYYGPARLMSFTFDIIANSDPVGGGPGNPICS